MRRIIYVWDYIEWGGAQIYYFALMREAKKKYLVTALVPENSSPRLFDYLKQLDISYELLPARAGLHDAAGLLKKLRMHWRKLAYENRLLKHLAAKTDLAESIVHIDMGFWQSLSTLLRLSRMTNVVLTIHTALPSSRSIRSIIWQIKGRVISQFSAVRIIASNVDARRSLARYLSRRRWEDIDVAYSGFNTDEIEAVSSQRLTRDSICEKYGLPLDRQLVFTVGQFIERKGCWTVLDSLKELRIKCPNVFFVWIGTTPLASDMIKKIKGSSVENNFRFMSSDDVGATRNDLLSLINIADMFVLASFQEGLPIALIEAMALGKPCIATNVNAIPEAIEHRKNGLLIHPGEPSQLAAAIAELAGNDELRRQLGRTARKTAFAKFNEKVAAEITLKRYAEVLG